MVRIDLGSRKIGPAIRFAVERFGPAQVGINAAKFRSVFEELEFQLRVLSLEGVQASQAVGVSLVEQVQRVGRFVGLLAGSCGIDEVMPSFERDGRVPGAGNEFPGSDRAEDYQIDQQPGLPCFPSESAA